MRQQGRLGICIQRRYRQAHLLCQPRHDKRGQLQDIPAPVSQRRNMQLDDMDAVKKIFPEFPRRHQFRQVAVG